jgi:hypothetical protein
MVSFLRDSGRLAFEADGPDEAFAIDLLRLALALAADELQSSEPSTQERDIDQQTDQ